MRYFLAAKGIRVVPSQTWVKPNISYFNVVFVYVSCKVAFPELTFDIYKFIELLYITAFGMIKVVFELDLKISKPFLAFANPNFAISSIAVANLKPLEFTQVPPGE